MAVGKLLALILLFATAAGAQEPRLHKTIHTPARGVTIDELGVLVKQQSGLVFSFHARTIQSRKQLPLDKSRYTLGELLGKMKRHFGADYRIIGDHIVFSQKTAPEKIPSATNVNVQTKTSGNDRSVPDKNKIVLADKHGPKKNISLKNSGDKTTGSPGNTRNSHLYKPLPQKNTEGRMAEDERKNGTAPAGDNLSPDNIAEDNNATAGKNDTAYSTQNISRNETATGRSTMFPGLTTTIVPPRAPSSFARTPALSSAPPAAVPQGHAPSGRGRRSGTGETWLPEKLYAAAGIHAEEVFYLSPSLRLGLPYAYGILGWSSDAAGLSTFRYGLGTSLRLNDRWKVHLQGVTGTLKKPQPVDSMGMTFNMEMKARHYRIAALAEMRIGSRIHISAGPSFNYLKTTFYYEGVKTPPDQIHGSGNSPDSFFSFFTPPFVLGNKLDRSKPDRITTWIGLQAGMFFSF